MNSKLCVIIPCGGSGERVGLPYPKELLAVDFHKSLIDYCFDLLQNYEEQVQIVIIINETKLDTVKYLKKYADSFNISFVYQKSCHKELIGAIESAKNMFLDYNLVLLPDTIIRPKHAEDDLIGSTLQLLDNNPFIFWVKQENNKEILAQQGAIKMKFSNGYPIVVDCIDKPSFNTKGLNGHWAAFAFNKDISSRCLEILKGNIEHDPRLNFKETELSGCPALEVEEAIDLGIWPAIKQYFGGYK